MQPLRWKYHKTPSPPSRVGSSPSVGVKPNDGGKSLDLPCVHENANSQMPRHLISDAHEWINEIPAVPIYYLAKPQPRERAWRNQRGKKTLLSLTLVRACGETREV